MYYYNLFEINLVLSADPPFYRESISSPLSWRVVGSYPIWGSLYLHIYHFVKGLNPGVISKVG